MLLMVRRQLLDHTGRLHRCTAERLRSLRGQHSRLATAGWELRLRMKR
jgi:hypothetical protein